MTDYSQIHDYLSRQRWFGSQHAEFEIVDVEALPWLVDIADNEFGLRIALISVQQSDGLVVYNLPIAYRREPDSAIGYGLIGYSPSQGDLYIYDALHDPQARQALLAPFFNGSELTTVGGLTYESTAQITETTQSETTLMSVDQSNSSIIVGETGLVKVFRKVVEGRNPDIEIQAKLTEAGSEDISPLYGSMRTDRFDLAMLSEFVRSATNGFESARASFRALVPEPDIAAEDAGSTFEGESDRLGMVLAQVHQQMRDALGTDTWDKSGLQTLHDRFITRLEAAITQAPDLAQYRQAIASVYAGVLTNESVAVQRVHGDLHLGQTLRTTGGWRIIDFEGEPAKPLHERIALDSPMRDVAGMLRSFDYAANSVLAQMGVADPARAEEWVTLNRTAFLRGYGVDESESTAATSTLLRAYELDKAIYEVVYEIGHRPDWAGIPLRAIERLSSSTS